nr:hypothetical protein HK105_002478 [Polyrhizophydium stewartii]
MGLLAQVSCIAINTALPAKNDPSASGTAISSGGNSNNNPASPSSSGVDPALQTPVAAGTGAVAAVLLMGIVVAILLRRPPPVDEDAPIGPAVDRSALKAPSEESSERYDLGGGEQQTFGLPVTLPIGSPSSQTAADRLGGRLPAAAVAKGKMPMVSASRTDISAHAAHARSNGAALVLMARLEPQPSCASSLGDADIIMRDLRNGCALDGDNHDDHINDDDDDDDDGDGGAGPSGVSGH